MDTIQSSLPVTCCSECEIPNTSNDELPATSDEIATNNEIETSNEIATSNVMQVTSSDMQVTDNEITQSEDNKIPVFNDSTENEN